jgi:hypothetical protein
MCMDASCCIPLQQPDITDMQQDCDVPFATKAHSASCAEALLAPNSRTTGLWGCWTGLISVEAARPAHDHCPVPSMHQWAFTRLVIQVLRP